MNLESIDYEILRHLNEDSRISFRRLSELLSRSPLTIKRHIKKLEQAGIIEKYGIKINYEKLGYNILAIIEVITIKGNFLDIKKKVDLLPNIFAVYHIADNYDLMLLGKFKSREELSSVIDEINSFDSIRRANTHLILNIVKEEDNIINI
ncbi:MAG: Lrp/AsnC family transcriptional regulator [Promethearchaeota archaeon]